MSKADVLKMFRTDPELGNVMAVSNLNAISAMMQSKAETVRERSPDREDLIKEFSKMADMADETVALWTELYRRCSDVEIKCHDMQGIILEQKRKIEELEFDIKSSQEM